MSQSVILLWLVLVVSFCSRYPRTISCRCSFLWRRIKLNQCYGGVQYLLLFASETGSVQLKLLNLQHTTPVRVHATVYAPPFFESRRESTPPTPPQFIKLFCYKLVDVMLH